MAQVFCGLDFGTSNSTVAVADVTAARLLPLEGTHVTLPSAVFWDSDGAAPVFGRAAIAAYVQGDDGRLMRGLKSTLGSALIDEATQVGARRVTFRQVLAAYIGHLHARAVAGGAGGAVVLGRPVHFVDDDTAADARAEAVLGEIARAAGFDSIAFQYEPIAAALEYEQSVAAEELVLIVDIGGGTSDVSVVRVSPVRARAADRAGDILGNDGIRVGGTDFDRLLSLAAVMPQLGYGAATKGGTGTMPRHYYLDLATWHRINTLYTQRTLSDLKALRHMADRPALIDRMIRVVTGRHGHGIALVVEAAKIALSEADRATVRVAALTGGPDPLATRDGFEAAVAAPLMRVEALLRGVLASAGVAPDAIGTVFITGGSGYLPAVRAAVAGVLPGVRQATGDMLGSVGAGLALEARRRFG